MPFLNGIVVDETGPPHAHAALLVDLSAIRENYRLLAARAQPARCAAVVKADAYGLGIGPVAKALYKEGCESFFVAQLDEAIELRSILPSAEIIVFGGVFSGEEPIFTDHKLQPILNDLGQIKLWSQHGKQLGKALAGIHIDTGMSRLGLPQNEIAELARHPECLEGIQLRILVSHLACSDTPDHPKNEEQRRLFEDAIRHFPSVPASLAASGGVFLAPEFRFDVVRPGASLYGVSPNIHERTTMRQAVQLQAKILQVRDVDSPQTVGYGAAHLVSGPMRIATIGVGYADGYLRSLSGLGMAWAGETPLPVVGRISMDLITLDISQARHLTPGDWVELIGPNRTVDMLAEDAGTIGYEILTCLGHRYKRRYVETAA